MDHNMHVNAPLHWGYGAPPMPSTPQSHWVPPPQSHSLKRALSESDCDELYSEESSKEQISPGEGGSCQLMSRKKRRGVIEKKRRDRINSSLSELKRLVPSAYEKQGSAKLEKAEILQLTVEHLKSMQSKGLESLAYDPQRFAMDYHIIGFRECAAEVARYLVTIEGMDIQDPLRLRLMSHLQYFAQQRELSAKGCASPSSWSASAASTGGYQPNCAATPYQTYPSSTSIHSSGATSSSSYVPNLATPIHPYPTLTASPSATNMQQHPQATSHHVTRSTTARANASATATSATNEATTMPNVISQQQQPQRHDAQSQVTHAQQAPARHETTAQPQAQPHQQQQQQQQHYTQEHTHAEHQVPTYIDLTNSQSQAASMSTDSLSYSGAPHYPVVVTGGQDYGNPNASIQYATPNGSKPYRPWGAEMAY